MGSGNDLNRSAPVIDVTSQDAESLTTDLIAYAKATNPTDKWTDFNVGQLARAILDQVAYVGDMNSFLLNSLINEAYSETAIRRQNLLDLARAADYAVPSAGPSSTTLRLTLNPAGTYPFTIDSQVDKFSNGNAQDEVIFMPIANQVVASYPGAGYVDIAAREGLRVLGESLGNSTGARNQRLQLAQPSVLDGTVTVRVNGVGWTKVDHAVDLASTTEGYLLVTDDADQTYVVFGDGVNGKIPPTGNAIVADYTVGGGQRSNLAAGTITSIINASPTILSVTNPVLANGGSPRPTEDAIRAAIPASLHAHSSIITGPDAAASALEVAGVAKSYAVDGNVLLRAVRLFIAPSGGGVATDVLKQAVQQKLIADGTMIGMRIGIEDPVYKPMVMSVLVHLVRAAKQSEIRLPLQDSITNIRGTGILDFNQVSFAGLDELGEPQINVTRVQQVIKTVDDALVYRVEILRQSVKTGWRRLQTTTGDGTIAITASDTNVDQRRREYVLRFTSATTFSVYERIIGTVKRVSDYAITDDVQDFLTEAGGATLVSKGFTKLNPDRRQEDTFTIVSNTIDTITIGSTGLFARTRVGSEYYVERLASLSNVVGSLVTITDSINGSDVCSFTVTAGGSAFVVGDELTIDVYPFLGDPILRSDEIPTIDLADLTIRLAGGTPQ